MLLTLMMLAGCNRYWYDTAEQELGNISLKPGVLRVEGDGYRLDSQQLAAFEGSIWIDGLSGEQEWNQVKVELAWAISSAAEGDLPRYYGVSLWNLNDLVEGADGQLLNASAGLAGAQVNVHQPSTNLLLEGNIAAPTDGATEMDLALGVMVEVLDGVDNENYALAGGAAIRLTANGRHDGSANQPLMGMSLTRVSGGDSTDSTDSTGDTGSDTGL